MPIDLRSSSFGLDTFAKHLKTHLFGLAYSRQSFEFVSHFVECDTVTVSPNQIIIIIIIIIIKVQGSCVGSCMMYGSETWPMKKGIDVGEDRDVNG